MDTRQCDREKTFVAVVCATMGLMFGTAGGSILCGRLTMPHKYFMPAGKHLVCINKDTVSVQDDKTGEIQE